VGKSTLAHPTPTISENDFEALQVLALAEGISYQSLARSILHKYVTGRLSLATGMP
jgi:predicted DNA binding CopG/RHH family protein